MPKQGRFSLDPVPTFPTFHLSGLALFTYIFLINFFPLHLTLPDILYICLLVGHPTIPRECKSHENRNYGLFCAVALRPRMSPAMFFMLPTPVEWMAG